MTIWWKFVFPLKNVAVLTSFWLWQKFCRTMVGTVQYGHQIWLLIVQRIFLKIKQISWRNMTFFNNLGFRAHEFLNSADLISALLTKLRFASPENTFDNFFRTIFVFSFFARFEKKTFYFLSLKFFGAFVKNCILTVQMTIW